MPYTMENLPDAIKGLPNHAQEIWLAAYNSAYEQYKGDEEKCNAIAWAAVKQKYEKNEKGEWVERQANSAMFICKDLEGNVPQEIQVIPSGYHSTSKGDFELDEQSANALIEAFDAQANDMVIDYEHQTLQGAEAPAAGWIKKLINKGKDGIWAIVEWTERAKQYLKNKEYRYVSPVFLKRVSDNKVARLINVALTNQPNIDGMIPLVNKLPLTLPSPQRGEDKGEGGNQKEVTQMKKLLESLGLSPDATEEEAIIAANKLKEPQQVIANKTVLNSLGLKEGAAESEVVGTIMAMKQSHSQTGDLAQKVKELSDKLAKKEAFELVQMAMKDGKITAAQKDWALEYAQRDAKGFEVFAAKASVVVPMGETQKGGEKKKGELDETTLMVAKMFGNKEEDIKRHLQ